VNEINASVPERDLVTYNFYKSQTKFCCEVMRICDEYEETKQRVIGVLRHWGGTHNRGGQFIRNEEIVYNLITEIGRYNIIYTGSWPNVITTLLQQFVFRGWIRRFENAHEMEP